MQTGPQVFFFSLEALVDFSSRSYLCAISELDHCTCLRYFVLGFVRLVIRVAIRNWCCSFDMFSYETVVRLPSLSMTLKLTSKGLETFSSCLLYTCETVYYNNLHKVTSGRITVKVSQFTLGRNAGHQNTRKNLVHSSTQNTVIINTSHHLHTAKLWDTSQQTRSRTRIYYKTKEHLIRSQLCLNHLFGGHSNKCFSAYLYSAGTQHENLLKSIDYEQCDLFYFAG